MADTSIGPQHIETLWTERCQFLVENLALGAATGIEGAKWEPFQLRHLNDDSTFRIETKTRQCGWSFTVAAEAVACALLDAESTAFVSINLLEAQEKVRYAKRCYENLGIGGLPGVVKDNELNLELSNGARIISLPSKPPRGKSKMNVILDELAHAQHDKLIYEAALPVVSRGGRLRIGSSPFGARGVFWEVASQELRTYPGYTRAQTPWWKVQSFCSQWPLPPGVEQLATEERVRRYGNERLQLFFDNLDSDSFGQEFECQSMDDSMSWFSWELIRACQEPNLLWWWAKSPDQVMDMLPAIRRAVTDARIEQALVGGLDVGRHKHLSELILVGVGPQVSPLRLRVSLSQARYDDQEACLRQILEALPIRALLIDRNGLGGMLAERLQANTVAEGVDFTAQSKALWAAQAKVELERRRAIIPAERDLVYQIHSIRKKITAAGNAVYDVEANEKHHGDAAWAWMLAIWAARGDQAGKVEIAPLPITWQRR